MSKSIIMDDTALNETIEGVTILTVDYSNLPAIEIMKLLMRERTPSQFADTSLCTSQQF